MVHEPLDASYGLETTEKPGIVPQVEGNCATGYVSVALDRLGKGALVATAIDDSALQFATIYLSACCRGFELESVKATCGQ